MRVLVTGATGFIGRRLVNRILDGRQDQVRVLARDAARARARLAPEVEVAAWDPLSGPPPPAALEGVGAVVHLAGESVAQRWSPAVKTRIRDSRILSTRYLTAGMAAARDKPRVLISGSAVGYYGARGDDPLDEEAPSGSDFLAEVCREWENEALRGREAGARVVQLRTGIVLGPRGGALAKMLPPFKMFIGGPLGDGCQWMSWIHLDDLAELILHAIRTEGVEGPLNAVAPNPVMNVEFARTLGRVLGRPAVLPMPGAVLRLLMGEFADMLLTGQRVIPKKAEASGFKFRFPQLEGALREILT